MQSANLPSERETTSNGSRGEFREPQACSSLLCIITLDLCNDVTNSLADFVADNKIKSVPPPPLHFKRFHSHDDRNGCDLWDIFITHLSTNCHLRVRNFTRYRENLTLAIRWLQQNPTNVHVLHREWFQRPIARFPTNDRSRRESICEDTGFTYRERSLCSVNF